MALIITIQQAKAALPRVLSALSNNALLPDFNAAEIKYLVPLVGFTLYDGINGKLNADPVEVLTTEEEALIPYLRRISALYAYIDDLGTDNAKITDSGIRSTESQNMPRVFGWQFNELRNTLLSKAFDATEVLLRFLFENKDDYTDWTDSEEYAAINSLLIKTGTDFDAHYKLWQPMRTFYSLKNLVDEVQEDFIKPAIGADLLTYLLELDEPEAEEKNILKLLKKAMAYKTIKKAAEHYSVRFDHNGFTIVADGGDATNSDATNSETAGRNTADLPRFEQKINACEKDAGTYLVKAKNALYEWRNSEDEPAEFDDAYDAGPLEDYTIVITKDRGNDTRKGFRF